MKPKWKGAGNTAPKKTKKPAGKPWECGCGVSRPGYLYWCGRCEKGQLLPDTR